MAALSAIVYFGTVGVFEHSIDSKIMSVEARLADAWTSDGRRASYARSTPSCTT